MYKLQTYFIFVISLICISIQAQDVALNDAAPSYASARMMAYEGNHKSATTALQKIVAHTPENHEARALLANSYSWNGQYNRARKEFNILTSAIQSNRDVWISAIKNELYAKNESTAYGLANKASNHLKNDTEIERLKEIAFQRIKAKLYSDESWVDVESGPIKNQKSVKQPQELLKSDATETKEHDESMKPETKEEKKELLNRLAIRNSYSVFDQRYDPMIFSSIEFKRQTLAGVVLPRINYGNRNGEHGVQFDIDFYPKFSKRVYAYMNYGYSNASIYPKHKVGGDIYINFPWAMEFSAGGRYFNLSNGDVSMITNSLGYYKGNYYFSLRSNLTPRSNNLTRVSGNLLIRKYLKDALNHFSLNVGMGYSPEIRQLISGDQLLAETLLYVESQRLSLQYQFTSKKSPNIYSTSLGLSRQELAFASGSYIWSVSAGLSYQLRF